MKRKRPAAHLKLAKQLILVQVRSRTNWLRHGVLDLLHLVRLLVDLVQHLQRTVLERAQLSRVSSVPFFWQSPY